MSLRIATGDKSKWGSMGRCTQQILQTNSKPLASRSESGETLSKSYAEMASDWSRGIADVFRGNHLSGDLVAGLTVAAVALPLNVALAIAAGLPASSGILAGAIGGAVAGLCGGSRLQVTGPAAALNVMVFGLFQSYGAVGVAAACLVVGFVQIAMSLTLAGKLVRHIPEAVLAGFTTGVGIKLFNDQVGKLLGLKESFSSSAFAGGSRQWLHDISWHGVVCGLLVTLIVMAFKPYKKIPAALGGILLATCLAVFYGWDIARVGPISAAVPFPAWPPLSSSLWPSIFLAAVPLGLLAGIESLISASAVDRMAKESKPHNSNLELMGQGLANLSVGLFAGMPVSGVFVRSSVNVQSGGRSRLATVIHAGLLLGFMVFAADYLAVIPLAALAGLLTVIALRLIEIQTLVHLSQTDKVNALAFLLAAGGTVTGHLLTGLTLGLSLSLGYSLLKAKSRGEAQDAERTKALAKSQGVRAVLASGRNEARKVGHGEQAPASARWVAQIRQRAHLAASAFVHKSASVTGRVVLGRHVHIAAESSVRADEGAPFFIGDNSNIQDGVVLHALKEKWVRVGGEDWAIYIGRNVSVAHQALVHGPCYVGDGSFIGFKAVVHDSVVGKNCYIGIGATVVGVEIPDGRYVPHGRIVDSQLAVQALPEVSAEHMHFNDDVVEVNKGLAVAYREQQQLFNHHSNQQWLPKGSRALRSLVTQPRL